MFYKLNNNPHKTSVFQHDTCKVKRTPSTNLSLCKSNKSIVN